MYLKFWPQAVLKNFKIYVVKMLLSDLEPEMYLTECNVHLNVVRLDFSRGRSDKKLKNTRGKLL